MSQHLVAAARRAARGAVLLTCLARVSAAQTQDEARMVVGLSAGSSREVSLYDVASQTILSPSGPSSAFQLHRSVRPGITASGHLTYFRGPRLGLSVEFTYLGLGTTDRCTLAIDGGDVDLQRACAALDGAKRSPATSEIQAGIVVRPLPHSALQPYLKAQAGMAFTPSSMVFTVSEYRGSDGRDLQLTVFSDDSANTIRPAWTAAFGISTAPRSGYQLRVEFRESWIPVRTVAGTTAYQGLTPPLRTQIKGFPSIVVGFDVVLARQRGRRY